MYKNEGDKLQFLDVNHVIEKIEKGGNFIKTYIKPTAKNLVFVNGKSQHPCIIY